MEPFMSARSGTSQLRKHAAADRVLAEASGFAQLDVAGGVMLTVAIAAAAFVLRMIPGLSLASPMILAVAIGIACNATVGLPEWARAGIAFVLRRVLRLAIILLGLQLTVGQIIDVGAAGIGIVVVTLAATFFFTVWLGRVLGVDRKLAELIAAGTSICGASAIIATNAVTRARGEDAAYALACVTLLGSIAMFVYPLLGSLLHLRPGAYGLWAGASIHEVAQVAAAAFQGGPEAGEIGTVTKLARVVFLAPIIMTLGALAARRGAPEGEEKTASSPPVPWFVLGFAALIVLNSASPLSPAMKANAGLLTSFMLTMALAAMGLQINIARLRDRGVKPLLLGTGATLFIALFSLTLVLLLV
jgi:uncharacterized integral membrane protein (TIGR00698 family)